MNVKTSSTTIRLLSYPGNTIKVVAAITTVTSSDIKYIDRATGLVSASLQEDVIVGHRVATKDTTTIPIYRFRHLTEELSGTADTNIYHIIVNKFTPSSPSIIVEFRFHNEVMNIRGISVIIYKSRA